MDVKDLREKEVKNDARREKEMNRFPGGNPCFDGHLMTYAMHTQGTSNVYTRDKRKLLRHTHEAQQRACALHSYDGAHFFVLNHFKRLLRLNIARNKPSKF